MNFWSDSVESESQTQNENYYFDVETPRGHLFVVLDFVAHDYANLDATLQRKLETIVGSFDTVPRFSADLFLGFLAREINNFLHDLETNSGGTELFCSGALCLVSANRLAYVLCGDTQLSILGGDRSLSLSGNGAAVSELEGEGRVESDEISSGQRLNARLTELGVRHWDGPLTGRVPAFTLHDEDLVLIATQGGEELSEDLELSTMIHSLPSADAKSIGEALRSSSQDLGRVLVITGPYDQYIAPSPTDLGETIDRPEQEVSVLMETGQRNVVVSEIIERTVEAELEQRINPQIEELKDGLQGKANSIDVLELNEILKNLSAVLARKADTAVVLELQRDLLKLSLASNPNGKGTDEKPDEAKAGVPSSASQVDDSVFHEREASALGPWVDQIARPGSFGWRPALLVLAIAIGGAFIGAWLQSRILKKNPEVWAVKTSGNQIWINRMDQGGQGNVTLNIAIPVRSRGEQTFSSFADVKQYIDAITVSEPSPDQTTYSPQENQPSENKQADTISKVTAKSAGSAKGTSQFEKTIAKKPSEPIASGSKKPAIKSPQKVVVPASNSPASAAALQRNRRVSGSPVASTNLITVGSGDTLNGLARRYKTTPDQLRKLNPKIDERGVIQTNQKILVPPPSPPKDSKGRRVMLVKQAN
jgi:LysM repeat protein